MIRFSSLDLLLFVGIPWILSAVNTMCNARRTGLAVAQLLRPLSWYALLLSTIPWILWLYGQNETEPTELVFTSFVTVAVTLLVGFPTSVSAYLITSWVLRRLSAG